MIFFEGANKLVLIEVAMFGCLKRHVEVLKHHVEVLQHHVGVLNIMQNSATNVDM